MQRDAEVAPKCLLKSFVIRKKGTVWKGRLRLKREEQEGKEKERKETWESDHGGLHHYLIITEQYP